MSLRVLHREREESSSKSYKVATFSFRSGELEEAAIGLLSGRCLVKGDREMMITAAQGRSARTLLNWSLSRLASAASVSRSDIDDFELERCVPKAATRETIQRALEAAGVVFLHHDDVRLRAAASEVRAPRTPTYPRRRRRSKAKLGTGIAA